MGLHRDTPRSRRGRGALSNHDGRFEARVVEDYDDGWGSGADLQPDDERPATTVTPEDTRQPFGRNDSPDVPFDLSLNPYKGCEHGCIYCFARPTHAYLGLSPGLDFETRLIAKPQLPQRLREALGKPGYEPRPVALGANTDPYQPAEQQWRITRGVLEVLLEHRHPVGLITKSRRVLRDLDLLRQLAAHDLVHVMVTVTTLDPALAAALEPRASAPRARLDAIAKLREAGVPTGVLVAPVIPGLSDHEIEAILPAVAQAGAQAAGYVLLRLPREIGPLFEEWLEHHAPLRKERVLALLRAMRGGQLYRSEFGQRMRGSGEHAKLIERRFDLARRRAGIDGRLPQLRCDGFVRPPRSGENLELFGP